MGKRATQPVADLLRLLSALGLLLVLVGRAPTAAAATPLPTDRHLLYGIAGHAWWLDQHLEAFIGAYRDLGITSVRLSIDWKYIEPEPGVYRWDRYDRVLGRLADERLVIVGVFVTVPAWAATDTVGCGIEQQEPQACDLPPERAAAFEAVARATVQRYPYIRHWEFWNEPDLWPKIGQDVGHYLPWLQRFYRQVKAVDPALMVAATSLSGWDYFGWMYDTADAWYGPSQRPWDALGFHPYNHTRERDESANLAGIRIQEIDRIHAEMVSRGDGHKPLWITEYGWEDEPTLQARKLRQTMRWMQDRAFVTMAHLHMLHDWERERYGLLKAEPEVFGVGPIEHSTRFVPKEPYYSAFRSLQRPGPPPAPATIAVAPSGQAVEPVFGPVATAPQESVLGEPLTRAYWERRTGGDFAQVQYFEGGRLEWTRADGVQRGLIGDDALRRRGWLDHWGRPTDPATEPQPAPSDPQALHFPETGHSLQGAFRAAWEAHGGVATLGFPRSVAFSERGPDGVTRLIQYTQRGRLEQAISGDGGPVRLGQLGKELLLAREWIDERGRARNVPLNPARPAFQPPARQ